MPKKYRVMLREVIFGEVIVKAESVEEAKKKALHDGGASVDWEDDSDTTVYVVEPLDDGEEETHG